ncbi:MAG: type IV pilus assembly protein FimV [Aquabacterium sp.]|uniref:type IV pilus assembly protein FimV n=1 Tax=Aquabacterium sp. TaxID=1872578 RepID=UPI003BBEA7DF
MNKIKRVSAVVLAGTTFALTPGASHGLGFGRPSSHAILGEPLRVKVPLRLESGEDVDDSCVWAEVLFGEDKLPAADVLVIVQSTSGGERVLKITTGRVVNEPVVTVTLTAGCQGKISRKFVAFADPPGMSSVGGADAPEGTQETGRDAAPASAVAVPTAPVVRPVRPKSPPKKTVKPSTSGAASSAATPDMPDAASVAAAAASVPNAPVESPLAKARRSLVLNPAPKVPKVESGRLVLDPVEADATNVPGLRMVPGMDAPPKEDDKSPDLLARRAAAAALWQALSASTEELARNRKHLEELEQRLAQLQKDGDTARATVAALEARVNKPDAGGERLWILGLGALSLLTMGLAGYMWNQLRRRQRLDEAWWQQQAASVPAAGLEPAGEPASCQDAVIEPPALASVVAPRAVERMQPAAEPVARESAAPGVASHDVRLVAAEPAPATQKPVSPAPSVVSNGRAPRRFEQESLRAVSVEELIDLEQQAEFFIVLGQDDAAVDLLESHVQSASGASPLPFLKLLEIYRRLGRREDYERVQSDFNQRFNAYAPAWETDLQHGHTLDDYPGVLERLQALWATPAQAMEVLEKSLTRPESGADTFELPAYRELLFLYAIARDLSERDTESRNRVDLILPVIRQGGAMLSTIPLPVPVPPQADMEPLMATRPVKAMPEVQPSLSLDLQLDDLEIIEPRKMGSVPAPGSIDFEHIDLPDVQAPPKP